jgi:hypothetical protein
LWTPVVSLWDFAQRRLDCRIKTANTADFCSLTRKTLIVIGCNLLPPITTPSGRELATNPLSSQDLAENCSRSDRLPYLQPIITRPPGDRLRLFAAYHDRRRRSDNLLTRTYTSLANHDEQIIGPIAAVVNAGVGHGPSMLFPGKAVTARPRPCDLPYMQIKKSDDLDNACAKSLGLEAILAQAVAMQIISTSGVICCRKRERRRSGRWRPSATRLCWGATSSGRTPEHVVALLNIGTVSEYWHTHTDVQG